MLQMLVHTCTVGLLLCVLCVGAATLLGGVSVSLRGLGCVGVFKIPQPPLSETPADTKRDVRYVMLGAKTKCVDGVTHVMLGAETKHVTLYSETTHLRRCSSAHWSGIDMN